MSENMGNQDSVGEEGQLALDVIDKQSEILIIAPISGVTLEEISVLVEEDTLTISGERKFPENENENFLTRECFWGLFSRSLILPSSADRNSVEASFSKGILKIKIPKKEEEKTRIVKIIEEKE